MGRADQLRAACQGRRGNTVGFALTVLAVLVAADAAGEGLNLQRAHLMVNYDMP
jgi:superfamily II DNA/RNA helicase